MTIKEKSSKRKCKALKALVESGEYSAAYALEQLEEFYDKGKVLEVDYEELAEWLEEIIDNPPSPEPEPEEEFVEEPIEEESIESAWSS